MFPFFHFIEEWLAMISWFSQENDPQDEEEEEEDKDEG